MNVTVAICTYNHCESLRETLESFRRVRVPEGLTCELLVVDSASTDATAEVIKSFRLEGLPVRYLFEPRQGLSFARNAALAAARGEIILFTDDDVRPPSGWIEGMCAPIIAGRGERVAGGVRIAPHLERPWMGWLHRAWLASTDYLEEDGQPSIMVGANMAFSREVLRRVPAFDTELGSGALSFHDESLFSLQLREAGYRIAPAFDTVVEHHFDASRLMRASFLETARRMGRSSAYMLHHWRQEPVKRPAMQTALWRLRLAKWRWQKGDEWEHGEEGMPEWEMMILWKYHTFRHYLNLRKNPRNYERHGLVKLSHAPEGGPLASPTRPCASAEPFHRS